MIWGDWVYILNLLILSYPLSHMTFYEHIEKEEKKGFHHQKERDCYLAACLWQKSNLIHCSAYWFHTYLVTIYTTAHGLRTPREEISFTARPKIQSQSQIFRYGRSIFCLPHRPKISDFFDLCLHWVPVVRGHHIRIRSMAMLVMKSSNEILRIILPLLHIYIIICQSLSVRPCVCPYAIYSLSFGPIWTLKVPMDFLGPGGGNKTICKVMGPKMKKKILLETPLLILLPT